MCATCSKRRSRTRRHAPSTAPPLIHVCRDADVEPAEPISVSIRSSTTTSTPKTVRAICWASMTKPWPTSDVANLSVATPSASVQRASALSSKPSLYIRFLMETPQPIPRLMLCSSDVRPEPPGNSIVSDPFERGSGMGSASVSRMQRATGATLSTACPVMRVSPFSIAFKRRTSTGDLPTALAILSI